MLSALRAVRMCAAVGAVVLWLQPESRVVMPDTSIMYCFTLVGTPTCAAGEDGCCGIMRTSLTEISVSAGQSCMQVRAEQRVGRSVMHASAS